MTRDDLPEISDEDAGWLSDNPNTSDIVEWVYDYALRCVALASPAPETRGAGWCPTHQHYKACACKAAPSYKE
jgi:hypothetical protein